MPRVAEAAAPYPGAAGTGSAPRRMRPEGRAPYCRAMDPTAAFVLGLLLGLAVGALVVVAVLRAIGRIAGSDPRGLPRLVVDGLRPGAPPDGVAVQRALARRLKRTGERTAAGRRVAAAELQVHVGPEDHDRIAAALGIEAAERDLADFYTGHARHAGWVQHGSPRLELVRDISLRPRQAFVRAVVRAPEGQEADRPPVAPRAASAAGSASSRADAAATAALPRDEGTADAPGPLRRDEALTDVLPPFPRDEAATDVLPPFRRDEAVTDVLPRGLAERSEAHPTQAYPPGFVLGDLVVVHGTDVRTVPPAQGVLRIGRGPQNDVVIDSPGIARDHVVVEARGDAWWIVPGTSESGTTLDGRALRGPAVLDGQALLELGRGVRVRLAVEAG